MQGVLVQQHCSVGKQAARKVNPPHTCGWLPVHSARSSSHKVHRRQAQINCSQVQAQTSPHACASSQATVNSPFRPLQHEHQRTHRRRASIQVAQAASAIAETSVFDELSADPGRRYIMISGKGGVGKTSLAASLAVKLAAAGHTTLVVSTDPAHSLSDSLAQDVSGGKPVPVEGTDLPLWGLEIDPEEAKNEFRNPDSKAKTEVTDFMNSVGLKVITDQLADLKLGELLNTPPPGLDESVAIAKVVQFVQSQEYARFSRIVFDTAPTGHTLRLLALPDFVEASLGKIIRLRKKLSGAANAVKGLFGASDDQDSAVEKLELLRERVGLVKQLFRDDQLTEFVIATIPTVLGINESARLLGALRKEQIPCKRIVVNQVIGEEMGDAYLRMKLKDQARAIEILDTDPQLQSLKHIRAPLLDLEVRGVPGLQYFGQTVWKPEVFESMNSGADRKFFLLGGKGGVGKTSSAASLAVAFAAAGEPTLVVSTDPAHSLSDALDQDVSGGLPVAVVNASDLPIYGMEIELAQAREEIRAIMAGQGGKEFNDFLDNLGLGMITDQLKELNLGELLDTPPPGIDEAVAISKVVQFLKSPEYSKFTRIIFDTAPTGHTLRLLSLPDFLDKSIGKIVRLRQKLTYATDSIKSMLSRGEVKKDPAVEKLEELKTRMEDARAMFRNKDTTEFIIVTIPTLMAASESARLAKALREEQVPCNTIVLNQVIRDDATEKFLAMRRNDQQRALQKIREHPQLNQLQLIIGPLFDLEVRGVPALQYFGSVVWK